MNKDLIYKRLKEQEDNITEKIGSDSWKKDSDRSDLTFQFSPILKDFMKICSKEFGFSKKEEKALLQIIKTKDAYDELDQEKKISCCISTIEDILSGSDEPQKIINDTDKDIIITMLCSINHISVAGIARYIALGSMNVKDVKEVLKEVKHYKRDITNRLNNYRNTLEKQYGDDWIIKINKEEKEAYINIYCKAYDLQRDVVINEINKRQALFKNKDLKNEANKMLNLEALNQYRIFLEKKYGDKWNNLMTDKERKDFYSLYRKVYPLSKNNIDSNIANKPKNNFEELNQYRIYLEGKYQDNWLGNMSKKEKDKFIDIYSSAYNIDPLKIREGFNQVKKKRTINELNDFIDSLFNKYGNDWAHLLNNTEIKQFITAYANTYKVDKIEAEKVVKNIFIDKKGKDYESLIKKEQTAIIEKLSDLALNRYKLKIHQREEFDYLKNELTRITLIPIINDSDIQKKYQEFQKLNKAANKFYEYINNDTKTR